MAGARAPPLPAPARRLGLVAMLLGAGTLMLVVGLHLSGAPAGSSSSGGLAPRSVQQPFRGRSSSSAAAARLPQRINVPARGRSAAATAGGLTGAGSMHAGSRRDPDEYALDMSSPAPLGEDLFTVEGRGLRLAPAGQQSWFYIRNSAPSRSPLRLCKFVTETGANPQLRSVCDEHYQWIVWFYGPAMFTADRIREDWDTSQNLNGWYIHYTPVDPGVHLMLGDGLEARLRVRALEILSSRESRRRQCRRYRCRHRRIGELKTSTLPHLMSGNYDVHIAWNQLPVQNFAWPARVRRLAHSPFRLKVVPAPATPSTAISPLQWPGALKLADALQSPRATGNALPYCEHARHEGRWVRCRDIVGYRQGCLRGGWVWLPWSCQYRVYDYRQLALIRQPRWIVIAGTSIIRGSFLVLLDQIAAGRLHLKNVTLKCWGWIDFHFGNLRVSYLDFRAHTMFPDTAEPSQGYTVPVATTYQRDAQERLRVLGRTGGGGPDVFYLQLNGFYKSHIPEIRSWLGPAWAGKFVVTISKPGTIFKDQQAREAQEQLEAYVEQHPDLGLHAVDEAAMGFAFVHGLDKNMSKVGTLHHHRKCSDADHRRRGDTVRFCSPSAEMSAQLILNVALDFAAPDIDPGRPLPTDDEIVDALEICQDCSIKRLFASINPDPTPLCYKGGPGANDACDDKDVTKCPQLAEDGQCDSNRDWMLTNCPFSCQACGMHRANITNV